MWNNLTQRHVRRTTLISCGCAAFLAALGLSVLSWRLPATGFWLALGLLGLCYRRRWFAVLAVVACGLMIGLIRGSAVQHRLALYDQFIDQKVTLLGTVTQDSTFGAKGQLDFLVDHVALEGRAVPGQVRITSFDAIEPKQGDVVQVSAKAKPGFGNYRLGLFYASVRVLAHDQSWLARVRQQFSAAVRNALPEPQASLGLGFLLGIKSQLPQTVSDQLKTVGLTHMVVASGYNLTILVRVARRVLAKRSKYQATLVAVLLMIGFLGVTGLSASMSRAALVTSLSLVAWYYGRAIHPVVLLLVSAAVTAAVNPLFLWSDVGWYLSFLAFGGIMLGAPLLQRRLFGKRPVPSLGQIALEALAAELATMPLVLMVFGSVSVVSLLANVLVAPLVPLAMLTTFVAGLASLVLSGVGAWLAWPAQWLLDYMTLVVQWLASIPWAMQSWSLSVAGCIFCYAVLVSWGWLMRRRLAYDYLGQSLVD